MMARLGDIVTISTGRKKPFPENNWLLNLDMVEQQTGNIIRYYYVPASALTGSVISFDTGNILYSKLRPNLNKVVIPTSDGFATSEMLPLRPDPVRVDRAYLAAYLRSSAFVDWAVSKTAGAKMPRLGTKELLDKEVPLPCLEEQRHIAAVLDKVSGLIALRRQQLAKLDELVKARFVELFGDVIQNDRGWEQYTFSDIATSRLGKMLDAKQQTGKYAYPYLANFNVQWFRFEIDNLNKMDFNEADRLEFELRDGDLLVCEGGEIGRCAVWHNEIQPCYFQKALHRVRCNQHIVLPDYMAWWFKYNCDHKVFAAIE